MGWEPQPLQVDAQPIYRLMLSLYSSRHTPYAVTSVHITARRSPAKLGFKATCLLLFPDSVGLGVGFRGSRSTQPTCRQMSTRPSDLQ